MIFREENLRKILRQELELVFRKDKSNKTPQLYISTSDYIKLFHPTHVEMVNEDNS